MRCVCWVILLVLLNVGCDKGTSTSSSDTFRVAMILPGSDTDKGWNQMAREGLDRIKSELGAETKLVTNVKNSEFGSQIDYFAGEGSEEHTSELQSQSKLVCRLLLEKKKDDEVVAFGGERSEAH